ncbi:MAG: beta-N-acetylhexosaminidase [Gammaproteobacteria bacterium]|nr:MAG: beta-N-acetylhexosaminidase [Gammaproteobacteria bacterium]
MSLGPLMIGFEGAGLSAETGELLRHPLVGGAVLFARNYETRQQLDELVQAIHAVRRPRLLTAVDQEGGRVQRFSEGFVALPPLALIGEVWADNEERAATLARSHAYVMATELRALHIDLSFAPVLDLAVNQEVIGDRAFDSDPEIVAALAEAYVSGMRAAGMAATVKHFPGHGSVSGDSHECTPVDSRPLAEILEKDALPFRRAIVDGVAGVMMAHVVYSDADARPASFSSFWIGEVLRRQMSYAGAVISDDICMGGAAGEGDSAQRARSALKAGCDVVLVCDPDAVPGVVDRLEIHEDPARLGRLAPLHGRDRKTWRALHADAGWKEAQRLVETLA